MPTSTFRSLFTQSVSEWSDDNVPRLSASLAFYTLLSLSPLLLIGLAVAGLAFKGDVARTQVLDQIQALVGQQGGDAIKAIIEHAQEPGKGIISMIIGTATLLFGASGVFGELQSSLNIIWKVKPKEDQGWFSKIRERFFSFLMVLGTAFLLLVSLLFSTAVQAVSKYASHWLPLPAWALEIFNVAVSFVAIAAVFAVLFRYVPDAKVAWRDIGIGAPASAALFLIGKTAIGIYLGRSAVASTYGAAGSLVIVLVWVYYCAQVVFMGAEFTQVYANRVGSGVKVNPNATPVPESKPPESKPAESASTPRVVQMPLVSARPANVNKSSVRRGGAMPQPIRAAGRKWPGIALLGMMASTMAAEFYLAYKHQHRS